MCDMREQWRILVFLWVSWKSATEQWPLSKVRTKKVDIRVGQMTVTLGLMSNRWKDGLLLGSCGYALLGLLYG